MPCNILCIYYVVEDQYVMGVVTLLQWYTMGITLHYKSSIIGIVTLPELCYIILFELFYIVTRIMLCNGIPLHYLNSITLLELSYRNVVPLFLLSLQFHMNVGIHAFMCCRMNDLEYCEAFGDDLVGGPFLSFHTFTCHSIFLFFVTFHLMIVIG